VGNSENRILYIYLHDLFPRNFHIFFSFQVTEDFGEITRRQNFDLYTEIFKIKVLNVKFDQRQSKIGQI